MSSALGHVGPATHLASLGRGGRGEEDGEAAGAAQGRAV